MDKLGCYEHRCTISHPCPCLPFFGVYAEVSVDFCGIVDPSLCEGTAGSTHLLPVLLMPPLFVPLCFCSWERLRRVPWPGLVNSRRARTEPLPVVLVTGRSASRPPGAAASLNWKV